ncbi:unnamed protein product [Rotaria sp. Silwood1]|nr:unnamed protein product [Rotaria sp. Silwood1]
MEKSPFYLTFNYNDKQIINKNFTITTELYYDKRTSINCENNQYRLCLVELSLQIQSDIMSIKFWCQPPAFLFEDFNQFSRFHTCILPIIDATQQPSITMIINSYDIGKIIPLTIANFTYLPEYYIEKNSEIPILIFNNENLLSRNVRYVVSENDDAIESELDDPDCIMEKINRTNGYSNQDDQSKDDEPDETAVPVDFASDIIPEDDRNQPIGEYDDSLAVNCTAGGPLYGHPNVEWIRVANASHFIIDQRINRNVDPDSDGIDFPKMDTYILQIRMIPYVFLQYVSVPASNVILLYVVVHYDSGRRHNAYHSKVEQSPVVENFLAKEPTRFFEVYLNATDDGLPPSDVTLDIGYCIAPKHKHPIIVDSDSSSDLLTGTIDVNANVGGSISSLVPKTIINPSVASDTLIPSQSQLDTVDVSINVAPVTQPIVVDEAHIPSITYEAQEPTSVRKPSDSLVETVDVSVSSSDSGYVPSETRINNQDELNDMQVKSPALVATIDLSVSGDLSNKPYSTDAVSSPSLVFNGLLPMTTSQVPANYFCYNNLQIVGNINVQNIFHINSPQQTPISDIINSQSESTGYSFSSFHYPYHTIVINLRVNIYVHTLTLGPQSNVQRYGLRLYNPLRNVDDTYYSSIIPGSNNQPAIVGIPLAKVAIRLYLNLYTTNDGRPPSNIKIMINACFDLSSISSGSSPMIGGQYYRSPSISQIPTGIQQQPYYESPVDSGMSMPTMDVAQSNNIVGAVDVSIIDSSLSTSNRVPSPPLIATIDISMPSPNKPVPFSRTPGQCFDQILIIGGSHITMIRSRNPAHQVVGPEINFGGTGYTFSSPSDTYEFEVHFAQPFTMKYIFIPSSANVESFKVEASHAGMLGVFTSTNTKDGLVVDGFPTMLVSMLVITIIHTTDGYLPSHITLSIEGNEAPEMTDCTPQLRLLGNPKQVTRVDIKTATMHIKPNNLINPNQDGMDFLTTEEYIIDIVLSRTMSIDSITLNPLTNVDSFKIQCHNSHGYYLEIKSIIGSKTINGLANTQANLIRIILLGTEDGNPPNHISIKIKNRFDVLEDQLTMTYTEQQVPISEEQFQLDSQSPTSVQLTANVDVQPIQEPDMDILPSPILAQPSSNIEYRPLLNSQSQYIQNQIPERNIQSQTNIVVEIIQQPVIQTQSSPIILQVQEKILVSPMAKPTTSLPSYLTQSPSAYSCSHNYQITTSIHINSIYTLCGCTQSSIIDSTSSNSLSSNDGYSFSSHHYPFHTIVVSLKFTGYVQSLSLGSKSNIQRYGLRVFNPLRNVDDTYYSSIDPNTGQPIISNIHMAKVAIRLYINLYTTNDGRPPSNIQLNFNICFDLRSSSNGDRRFVTTEQPVIPSSMLIPERTLYVQQQETVVQPIVSPVELPIRTPIMEQFQQPMMPSISTQIIVETPNPVILTQPSNIMLIVQILPSPTLVGTRTFDQPPSIDTEVSVVIQQQQQQQPIISPQSPSAVIRTIFSEIQSAPQATIVTLPSPVIDAPRIEASATISIVEQPVNIQRIVDNRPQQAIISPSLPMVIVETIFSPIRLAPQETILTMPSPLINAPIVETSASISITEQSIRSQLVPSFQQRPVIESPTPTVVISTIFSSILPAPQATVLTCPSPIIDAPILSVPEAIVLRIPSPVIDAPIVQPSATILTIEKPVVYQPSPIDIVPRQQIVSSVVPSPIIKTVYSSIQSAPQEIIVTISSPIIESSPIVRTSETISIVDKPQVFQTVPIDFQPKVLIQEQQQIISPAVTQPDVIPSLSEVAIRVTYSSPIIEIQQQQPVIPSPSTINIIRPIPNPRIQVPVYDTLSSPIITPSPSIAVVSSYAQPIDQQPAIEERLPSEILSSLSIEIQAPKIRMIPSPIISPPIIATDPHVPLSIPSSGIRTEMCNCQCPISGFVPIVYNNRQQSCTIGTRRKRRDRHFIDDDDDDDDHYFRPIN